MFETEHTEKYYTSQAKFDRLFLRTGRQLGFTDAACTGPEALKKWQTELRQKLLEVSGITLQQKCEPYCELIETKDMGCYVREKLLIKTEEDVYMPVYALVPKKKRQGSPCIIATHGHASCGKNAIAYRVEIPAVKRAVEEYNYTYGITLVNSGYTVFCPDARGFGERRERSGQGDEPDKFTNSTCTVLNNVAISLGQSLTGLWIWDLMRLIDYIKSRPDTSDSAIGCIGLSGGGLQSLWLAALDERVALSVVSGYFYGVGDALLRFPENCSCNYVPGLWRIADMGDIGALIAPRPLFIESADADIYNGAGGLKNVEEQLNVTGKAYLALGARERLEQAICHGGHRWYGSAYNFIAKYM